MSTRRGQHVNAAGFAASPELPYGLTCISLGLMVERVYETLDAVQAAGQEHGLPPLRAWAGQGALSTLVSAAIVHTLAEIVPEFAPNGFQDGYPDVLLRGAHRNDCARAASDGIEVKTTSRAQLTQTDVHVARAGWYLVVQLQPDAHGNELPRIAALYLARLTARDFGARVRQDGSVQIRINRRGAAKLRAGLLYSDTGAASLPVAA